MPQPLGSFWPKTGILALLFLFVAAHLWAQRPPSQRPAPSQRPIPARPLPAAPRPAAADTFDVQSTTVQIIRANVLENQTREGVAIRYLQGQVELRQQDAFLFCDTAIIYPGNQVLAYGEVIILQGDSIRVFADTLNYAGDLRVADLKGNVALSDLTQQLFTEALNYDLNTKIARYEARALITNGETQLRSRRGTYYAASNDAYFQDSVLVVDEDFTLRSDSLRFNTGSKTAYFIAPTLIVQDSAKIYTEGGYYDTGRDEALFDRNPQFLRGAQKARSQRMRYQGSLKTYTLEGEARAEEGERLAQAETIRYDELNDITYLEGAAFYRDSLREIAADTIINERKSDSYRTSGRTDFKSEGRQVKADRSRLNNQTKESELYGNVVVADSTQILMADTARLNEATGWGFAAGAVNWRDTVQGLQLLGDRADFNTKQDFLRSGGRPLLIMDVDGDSLYLAADSIISRQDLRPRPLPDSLAQDSLAVPAYDTVQIVLAFGDVRIYKSNLQALCDSLSYHVADSTLYFYQQPIMWSDTSQLSADTMVAYLRNGQLDRILLHKNAFVINSPDEIYFNQVKGRDISAYFRSDTLREVFVQGNGQTVYYALDESGAYVAVNRTECSEMRLFFKNNNVSDIKWYVRPQASLVPMQQADHVALRLPGFAWRRATRPRSLLDLATPQARRLIAMRQPDF